MALAEPGSAPLHIEENGDVVGTWRVCCVDRVPTGSYVWKDTHPLTKVALEVALTHEDRDEHLLLVESGDPRPTRALLVKLMDKKEETPTALHCQFVGPVHFRRHLDDKDLVEKEVRIGDIEGIEKINGKARDYVHKGDGQDRDADPNFQGSERGRALFCGYKEVVNLLRELKAEREVDKTWGVWKSEGPWGMTMLLVAAELNVQGPKRQRALLYGDKVVVDLLMSKGNLALLDKNEWTALLLAVEKGKRSVIEDDQDVQDSMERKALLLAAEMGLVLVIKVLLEKMADLNVKDSMGRTALLLAAEKGQPSVIEVQYTKIKDSKGQTALHLAAENGNNAVVKLLLEKGADLTAQDPMKRTALLLAAEKGHASTVDKLLDGGAGPNDQDLMGRTALLLAAEKGHASTVNELLDGGAGPNDQDLMEQTALLLAAEKGNDTVVKLLLGKEADPNTPDSIGRMALLLAAVNGDDAVVKLLLENGVNLDLVKGQKGAEMMKMTLNRIPEQEN